MNEWRSVHSLLQVGNPPLKYMGGLIDRPRVECDRDFLDTGGHGVFPTRLVENLNQG